MNSPFAIPLWGAILTIAGIVSTLAGSGFIFAAIHKDSVVHKHIGMILLVIGMLALAAGACSKLSF